ncbi:DUF7529 family protein [Halobacterium wangiae]|uniref:DUF7529 family protein n=1 Tax=Halobacterium wangiae TaxID=2902623 RepID=UPI001E3F8C2A|nr:hypothetical protein [Halobacterium wangiae]
MVNQTPGGGRPSEADRLAQTSESVKSSWERTVHDMKAMAADREEKGFSTFTAAAGDTAPVSPQMGESDEFGLTFIISGSEVPDFEDSYIGNDFTETGVYQSNLEGHVYIVTEYIDMEAKEIIFLAGAYQMRNAPGLVRAAIDRGEMYSRVKTIDHTEVGTFKHDDVSAFFPNPDEFYAYEFRR